MTSLMRPELRAAAGNTASFQNRLDSTYKSGNVVQTSGATSEIERVLEREAKEGGADILIPVSLDDFVYGDWAPAREDIAAQVRSRVITRISVHQVGELDVQIGKVVSALRK
ncbi:hypothetical protein LP417_27845 [Polaromonas sp. P1-6]|nr:hypothetical protein LP417_27845 [Polaromonas sp. P1-6]